MEIKFILKIFRILAAKFKIKMAMKKQFMILMLAMIALAMPPQAKSQETLQFYDFENWIDGVNPVNWSASFTINIQTGLFPIPIKMNFGKKNSSSPYAGSYDLQISPYHFAGMAGLPAFVIPGIAQLGINKEVSISLTDIMELMNNGLDFSDPEALIGLAGQLSGLISPGVPVRGNVSEVKAFIRYLPDAESTDTARIIVATTRRNPERQMSEPVAMGMFVIENPMPTYTEISIPLMISEDNLTADSISLVIVVGGLNASLNTKLWIDNISLVGQPLSVAEKEIFPYSVYPNPTTEIISITPGHSQLLYSVKLFDISGKLVIEKESLRNHTTLDVRDIAKGVYLLELTQEQGKYTQKIIIQ